MSSTYRRVASDDVGNSNVSVERRSGRGNFAERLNDKIVALLWVILAVVVGYWSGFFTVMFASSDANRFILDFAFLCLGVNTVLVLYLCVYLPRVKGLNDSSAWSVYCPRVIPTITLVGVICGLSLIRATWPVWGFLAPLILGIEMMGVLFSSHFIPWFF